MISACCMNCTCHTGAMNKAKYRKTESKQSGSDTAHNAKPQGRKVGYVRVSDADQSEDLQVDALEAAGCDVIYGDLGVSGARIDRRSLETLWYDLQAGDVLVVWKLDRLGRSMLHLLQMLEDLSENGIDFIAVTQGIDTTTAIGRMLYGHLAVFAEFEREQIRERTKAGMEAARARGVHIGRPRAIPPDVALILRERLDAGEASIDMLAEELDLSEQTIVRAVLATR